MAAPPTSTVFSMFCANDILAMHAAISTNPNDLILFIHLFIFLLFKIITSHACGLQNTYDRFLCSDFKNDFFFEAANSCTFIILKNHLLWLIGWLNQNRLFMVGINW